MLRNTLVALALLPALPALAGAPATKVASTQVASPKAPAAKEAKDCPMPAIKANPLFEKLKGLVGTWEAKTEYGTTKVTYRLTSADSTLVEDMSPGQPHEMLTMYAPDKDGVVATHYCGAGNQPRMRATSAEGGQIKFAFLDVTNLVDPKMPVMNNLVVTLKDADHFTQEWTSKTDGKEEKMTFTYSRVK